MKVVNQSILSTKHLLTTNSEVITFNKEFYDYFTILGGEINPIINNNEKISNIEDYAIYIDPNDIIKMEEQDYDSLYNTCIGNGRFYIRNIKKKEEDILIECEGNKELFLSETTLELMKKGKGLIYFRDMDDDVKLFEMTILNQELTKPLYSLMELLNKQSKPNDEDEDRTINSVSQRFLDLLIESGIDANVVAAELILNRLIRSKVNIYDRPDFRKEEIEDYDIYTVARALERNKSPLVGISFQNIKRQFLSDALYEERDGESFLDPFYYTEIDSSKLQTYRKASK